MRIKRKIARLIAFAMVAVLMMAPTINAQAAPNIIGVESESEVENGNQATEVAEEAVEKIPVDVVLKCLFSADLYAKENPDVVAVLGDDPDVLYAHFREFGIKEGRTFSPVINVQDYLDGNPDLKDAFGDDLESALLHFATDGIYETANGARQSVGVLFNPVKYMNENPEAVLLLGEDYNIVDVVALYVSEGAPEGSWSGTTAYGDAPAVSAPATSEGSSSSGGGASTSAPAVTKPDDGSSDDSGNNTPVCDHSQLSCGDTCEECGAFIDHDFGPNGSAPKCQRCNGDYVQLKGCEHEVWENGTCKACWLPDTYYSQHDNMRIGESCPTCKYQGVALWAVDDCPKKSDHANMEEGEECGYCGYEKPADVIPDVS